MVTASVPDPAVLGRPPAAVVADGVLDADVARTAGTAGFFASSSSSLGRAQHTMLHVHRNSTPCSHASFRLQVPSSEDTAGTDILPFTL